MVSLLDNQRDFSYSLEQMEAIYWGKSYERTPNLFPQVLVQEGSYAFALPPIDILAMNRTIGWGWSRENSEKELDRMIQFYHDQRCPRFFLQLSPLVPRRKQLTKLLRSKGFRLHNYWSKLWRPIAGYMPPVESFFDIRVISKEQAEQYAQTITQSFAWEDPRLIKFLASAVGKEGYSHYLLYYRGEIAAAGALHIQGPYASMAFAGTLPKFRSMGAQHLLISRRIQDASKFGAQYLFAETGVDRPEAPSQSFRNLQHFGFDLMYERENWLYEKSN